MLTKTKIKWGVSIILAGILLALALVGGQWGTSYAANDGISAVPHINFIVPSAVKAGSPATLVFISGTDFGTTDDTGVRLVGDGVDEILDAFVTANGIWVDIKADYLLNPITYQLSVVMSTVHSSPTTPITPWDVESNAVPFRVYTAHYIYLPIVTRSSP
jgi:hypothetical protein